jgi:hypothetical protein
MRLHYLDYKLTKSIALEIMNSQIAWAFHELANN